MCASKKPQTMKKVNNFHILKVQRLPYFYFNEEMLIFSNFRLMRFIINYTDEYT